MEPVAKSSDIHARFFASCALRLLKWLKAWLIEPKKKLNTINPGRVFELLRGGEHNHKLCFTRWILWANSFWCSGIQETNNLVPRRERNHLEDPKILPVQAVSRNRAIIEWCYQLKVFRDESTMRCDADGTCQDDEDGKQALNEVGRSDFHCCWCKLGQGPMQGSWVPRFKEIFSKKCDVYKSGS